MTATHSHDPRHMSPSDWAALGVNQVAYVKRVTLDNAQPAYAIHAADGTQLAVMENRDLAFAAVRQNDLEPMSVH